MPSINRANIITGPALVQFGGQSFWSKGDIVLKPIVNKFAINVAAFGEVDGRINDKKVEVTFEPDGRYTSALLAVLFPYAALNIGASLYGGSDAALVVWSRAGTKVTLPNAAITKLPNLNFGVGKTITGSMTFTGLLQNSTAPETAGAYWLVEADAYPGDAGFATSDILTKAYASAWGSSPWDAFLTEGGWDVQFDLSTAPQMVDGLGTVDITLQELKVTATAIPVGPTEDQVLAATQQNQEMGTSYATANDLIISATGVYFSLSKAGLLEADLGYGSQRKRIGPCKWQATRTITDGVPDPLYFIGTAAPV
jgi:hypothetical protein